MGIKYVLLPKTELDPVGGPAEARLLRSGAAGLSAGLRLAPVDDLRASSSDAPAHRRSPAPASSASATTASSVSPPPPAGYTLRVHFTPYWTRQPAPEAAWREAANGMTELTLPRSGRFTLDMPDSVIGSLDIVYQALTRSTPVSCAT